MALELEPRADGPGLDTAAEAPRPGARLAGVLTLIGLLLLLGWFGMKLFDPATLPISQVRIEGDFTRLSPADLQRRVSGKAQGGFFNLNVDAVRLALLAEPWVSRIAVKRVWPDTLRVIVTEQSPAARWGERGLLNTAGQYFAPEAGGIPPQLPLLNGPPGSELVLFNRFKDLQAGLEAAGLSIKALNLDERRAWSLRLGNGARVILGRHDFEARLRRLLRLVPVVLAEERERRAETIDMRYTNGFAVQWQE